MDHRGLDDRALLTLARDGSAPAFAALVHRHFAAVESALGPTADRHRARVKVFVRAMRRLDQATEPFSAWIEQIAFDVASGRNGSPGDAVGGGASGDETTAATQQAAAETTNEADACTRLWRELAARWPDGRRPVRVPTIVTWLATLMVAVALSVAVPWITLGQFDADDGIPALRAFPIDSQGSPAAPDETTEEEPEPLPTYEFPIPPEADEPPPAADEPPADADEPPDDTDEPPDDTDEPPDDTDEPPADADEPPAQNGENSSG